MRALPLLLLIAAAPFLLAAPVRAQPAPPPPPPAVTITLPELDELIRGLAEAPAKFTLPALNFLLEKRQRATAPTPEPKAD